MGGMDGNISAMGQNKGPHTVKDINVWEPACKGEGRQNNGIYKQDRPIGMVNVQKPTVQDKGIQNNGYIGGTGFWYIDLDR
jgi:hypothetical protein